MGAILQTIEELSGGKCYQTERFTLDHFVTPEYQDKDEVFNSAKIFETDNKQGRNILLEIGASVASLFTYFLDGSRRTYKIVDFGSTDGKFLPIVAGQIGAAVCARRHKKLKKYAIKRENAIALPDRMGGEFEKLAEELPKIRIPRNRKNGVSIGKVLKYTVRARPDRPFENLAIAKIQTTMMAMEVELIREMVHSHRLKTNHMLMIDGSLQFSGVEDEDVIFENVIGVSKSFNPNLQGILKSRKKQIGNYLTDLKLGERTAVYRYDVEGRRRRQTRIGAWYLRIHEKGKVKKPLDGVIKIEKIATTKEQKEDGFDSEMINEISRSLLLERNVTCYGNDERWANHLYPIYLTELLLKNSFAGDAFFLNIF
ncbi:MAG: hypothetical protein GY801_28930 [bacterium]|nr:hypothetical protein [bacterium]